MSDRRTWTRQTRLGRGKCQYKVHKTSDLLGRDVPVTRWPLVDLGFSKAAEAWELSSPSRNEKDMLKVGENTNYLQPSLQALRVILIDRGTLVRRNTSCGATVSNTAYKTVDSDDQHQPINSLAHE